ncbi:MAG: peptidoglycan-binding protein [Acidimicrobiales bacterium]
MSPDAPIHLKVGDVGPEVVDVQHRLGSLGLSVGLDTDGTFGPGTRSAIEAFQYRRGLRLDGVCGPQTWSVLVEAGQRLGDRFLYRCTPMLRGDDVAELQQRLSALGFDIGRVDGIFGDRTSAGLSDFQRNVGLPVDGIAGSSTVNDLLRLGSRHDGTELVSSVRDREQLRQAPRTLANRHVAIGEEGGLGATVGAIRRLLVGQGALVTTHHHPDGSVQASEANAGGAEVYVGLRLDVANHRCTTAYYSGYRYSSPGGRRLAELLQATLSDDLRVADAGSRGMSLPVLRETRMPAVICEVGPASVVVEQGPILAKSIVGALTKWVDIPWD